MILVTGATGNIGSVLTQTLVGAGHKVRALTRDVARASAPLNSDASLVQGDLTRPETLSAALTGVEKAFFVANAGPRLAEVGGNFFDAARAAGVRYVVAVSSATSAIDPPVAIGRWHFALEERLKASGLSWTMLRPGPFASNTLHWAQMIRTQGVVFAPSGTATCAPIDPRDIAGVAFVALTSTGHEGKTYLLTGSELLNAREQVEKIGKALGTTIRFVEVPDERARAGMLGSGIPEIVADAILELVRAGRASARAGGRFRTATVREVTGREAGSYDDWLRDNVAAFA
jgi:uncharacterized protein YbjT (DUF2867 family)